MDKLKFSQNELLEMESLEVVVVHLPTLWHKVLVLMKHLDAELELIKAAVRTRQQAAVLPLL